MFLVTDLKSLRVPIRAFCRLYFCTWRYVEDFQLSLRIHRRSILELKWSMLLNEMVAFIIKVLTTSNG